MGNSSVSWYVRIFGIEDELKKLHDLLDSPECRLLQFKPPNEGCYLTSCSFSKLTDQEAVLESAKKLVTLIRAFAKLELGRDFQSINVGTGKITGEVNTVPFIIRSVEGKPDDVFAFAKTAHATASANVAKVKIQNKSGKEKPQKRKKKLHDKYLNRCDDRIDSAVFDALYYFAEETSYYNLYKVFEIIKSVTDKNQDINKHSKMISRGWVKDEDEVFAFKNSANCYGAVKNPDGKYILRHSKAWCLEQIRLKKRNKYTGVILEVHE